MSFQKKIISIFISLIFLICSVASGSSEQLPFYSSVQAADFVITGEVDKVHDEYLIVKFISEGREKSFFRAQVITVKIDSFVSDWYLIGMEKNIKFFPIPQHLLSKEPNLDRVPRIQVFVKACDVDEMVGKLEIFMLSKSNFGLPLAKLLEVPPVENDPRSPNHQNFLPSEQSEARSQP